jgi:ubiquitin-protein ligase E3 A
MQSIEQQKVSRNRNRPKIFSFLAHPFFLIMSKKLLGLYYDNKIKMMRERRNNLMSSIFNGSVVMPYFKMKIQRDNILLETLSLIELQEQENSSVLRKQLFIEFENEQGIDQGGISKEFFQLTIDELLNKGYTFFSLDERTGYYWISPCSIETEKEFRLVGILFGIAIYNNILLDVQFPPVFFRKLMGKQGVFEDLYYSHPQLYQSLKYILDFDGSNEEFEETFMISFQISMTDSFDSVVNFNLKEDGDKIHVTLKNRQEFVDLYADFILNSGIDNAFSALRRGFMKMTMHSPLNKWFLPEELEILLCGTKVMDWNNLEGSTIYDTGFDATHATIKQFWSIFNEFTDEQKQLFLKFTTGTDRCPHGGLSELKLTIARNGPDSEKY